jgi:hypothetical protein
MPEENRVFDVARPGRTAPEPTSKPVIVGHHPTLNDPMVKEERHPMDFGTEAAPTRISVSDDSPAMQHAASGLEPIAHPPAEPEPEAPSWSMPSPQTQPEEPSLPDLNTTAPEPEIPAAEPEPTAEMPPSDTAAEPLPSTSGPASPEDSRSSDTPIDTAPPSEDAVTEPIGHVEALHFQPDRRRGRGKWIILAVLILLAGAYLAIDSGLVASGVKLPFHIFKQKTETPVSNSSTTTPSPSPTSSLPAGFTKYNLSGTDISFAAPSAWGQPTSSTENGYSSRSTAAKPDGTYAYLVSFATNKDVQVAVTSSKYLPPARDTTYYDYLQWCSGTNDSKIYKSLLHFTSANGVDTPSTTTCDQGPLSDATKLDSSTIVQLKTKDPAGAIIGDLYTKNLSEKGLPVFRVKDAAMTSGDNIKQLLSTVKTLAAS